jgi:hypothetical protein
LLGGEIGLFALRTVGFFESTPGFLILHRRRARVLYRQPGVFCDGKSPATL